MKKYRHKLTGRIVIYYNPFFYMQTDARNILLPHWVIDNSSEWEEVPPEPIFTTEDGMDIFEERTPVYAINTKTWVAVNMVRTPVVTDETSYGWRYYSTKEARLRFIIENNPILTLGEIEDVGKEYGLSPRFGMHMYEAIEKKLKKNDSNL